MMEERKKEEWKEMREEGEGWRKSTDGGGTEKKLKQVKGGRGETKKET